VNPRIPRFSGKELLAALNKSGFETIRTRGSHHFARHADGRSTMVPVHRRETPGPGLLSKILRDCEVSREELRELLWAPTA
jgi:predicted RNA binding protein YcfA (HicA-like mRNA interferase family)